MPRTPSDRYRLGLSSESLAALLLRLKGYRILARRLRTPLGEIDIVACRARTIALVEVKASHDLAQAHAALLPRQRERLARAANWFLGNRPEFQEHTIRFDFIAVAPLPALPFLLWPRHYPNAWDAGTG